MECKHGVPYPAEGPEGPWICRENGSNPNCSECLLEPSNPFIVIYADTDACTKCGNRLNEEEKQSIHDADTEDDPLCNNCLRSWAAEEFPSFMKVLLPLRQGDMSCLAERVWCRVLTGDRDAGTGIIENAPVVCEWVKHGDKVTFEDIYPEEPPYTPIVTAVIQGQGGREA